MNKIPALKFLLFAFLIFKTLVSSAQAFESSSLPIIKITSSFIPDQIKIPAEMVIINNEEGKLNLVTDEPEFSGVIGIETRGSSSQFFYPKKSYSFETRTELGENLDTVLLGMPSENDWVLYAPYGDKTLMRNVLTYDLGNKTGNYAPRTRFCELLLNNEYMGVYVLMEKIKRDKNRVAIKKVDDKDDEITGGYILNIDRPPLQGEGWRSSISNVDYNYVYPKADEITPKQKEYIKEYITDFERLMKSSKYSDPEDGFAKYIDIPSFVDYMIMTEVTKNVDGYRLSTYLHKDQKGKLKAGPLWDYNLAYGNADYCQGDKFEGWAVNFGNVCPEDELRVPFWWEKFKTELVFVEQLKSRWTELRQTVLQTQNILNYIDSTAIILEEAQKRNFTRWPILGIYVWPNPVWPNSYFQEVENLKKWITSRMQWLDEQIGLLTPVEENPAVSNAFSVYPNPFDKQTTFKYSGNAKSPVLKIYDLTGRTIAELKISTKDKTGITWIWDGTAKGAETGNGFYIINIEINGKIVLRQKIYKRF